MRIDLHETDDWIAIYINKNIVMQGHSLHLESVLNEIKKQNELITEIQSEYFDEKQMEEMGFEFPKTLK